MANVFHFVLATAACCFLVTATPVSWDTEVAAQPVSVVLYYESLCESCHYFITGQLMPTWEKVKDIGLMNVTLLPYGNAREKYEGGKWKFECQHGELECKGNVMEVCTLHYYPLHTDKHMQIIDCVETGFADTEDWHKTLDKCASKGLDVKNVTTCATGMEGNKLQHQVALRTGPHQWVPWVILDGVPSEAAQTNLLKEVCKFYKGTPPSVCKQ